MRITGHNVALPLCLTLPTLLILGCAYRVGFMGVSGVSWLDAVTSWQGDVLSSNIVIGLMVIAALFGVLANRLFAYAKGELVRPLRLVVLVLAVLAAVYVATYDRFGLEDVYPFAVLFVISMLIFRFETRVVAAVLFGVIMIAFFSLGAKEIGERDAKQQVRATAAVDAMAPTINTLS